MEYDVNYERSLREIQQKIVKKGALENDFMIFRSIDVTGSNNMLMCVLQGAPVSQNTPRLHRRNTISFVG